MKKILTLLLATILIATAANAQDAIFKKYSGSGGVTIVNISKTMLGLAKIKAKKKGKSKDIAIGDAASRLNGIKVLKCENSKVNAKLQKDLMKIIKNGNYEEIISQVDGKEKNYILQRQIGNDNYEYIIVSFENNETSLVNITGKLSLEEIQAIGSCGD